jgi:gas vesicle protein
MFGRKKKKKKGMVDKLVMGAIIGGAIGSVVGMTVAPKKGEETRKYLKEKGKEAIEKSKEFINEHKDQTKDRGGRVWKSVKSLFRK